MRPNTVLKVISDQTTDGAFLMLIAYLGIPVCATVRKRRNEKRDARRLGSYARTIICLFYVMLVL